MCRTLVILFFSLTLAPPSQGQEVSFGEDIFNPVDEHTHGSTVVELPNGDVLAAWFQGSGERWADDVRIVGARKSASTQEWSEPFPMADVPEFPDVNPVLFLDPEDRLWLVWYTVLANQWESSLIKYRISSDYLSEGAPKWSWQDVIHVRPGSSTEFGIQPDDAFVSDVRQAYEDIENEFIANGMKVSDLERWMEFKNGILAKAEGKNMMARGREKQADSTILQKSMGYPMSRRVGWQTKNKAIFHQGRMILPLYSDGLEMSIYALSDDLGAHWKFSKPIVGIANIQASTFTKRDGALVAYMRDNGPAPKRHVVSTSTDNGLTWSKTFDSDVVNPGSGSDAITLKSGNWVIAYNNLESGRHSLAIALSEDEGKNWHYMRHVYLDESMQSTAAYPTLWEGKNGKVHLTYSFVQKHKKPQEESIRYFSFSENWVRGDDAHHVPLLVGAAVRNITPNPLLPVSGGIGVPRPVERKEGNLFVRVLVLRQGEKSTAIVGIDNLGWPKVLGDRIRERVSEIAPKHILIGSTHTHSAPDAYAFVDSEGKTHADFDYLERCIQAAASAIQEAFRQARPAHLKISEGIAEGKIAYNYYAERLYDPRCNVLQAVSDSDSTDVLATLINYAMHPEVIGSKRGILSPDFCGPLYDHVEAKTGAPAIFMNGALGGMVTADNRIVEHATKNEASDYLECQRIGNLLGQEALRMVNEAPLQKRPNLQIWSAQIDFPVTNPMMIDIIKSSKLPYDSSSKSVTTTMNLLNVGSAQFLTIPGEALPNIGYYLKRKMKGEQNFLLGLTNDAFGYMLTRQDYDSFRVYDYITRTSLGEDTGEVLLSKAKEMIRHSRRPGY
ncbi:MAG: exo-alpha-sialidase [Saprospiraceae bacterium]|nr:exo-alpha-sialidase [Saprospiraceae bacterium]